MFRWHCTDLLEQREGTSTKAWPTHEGTLIMSNFSNKLCNPTPFPGTKKWERGIEITIPAFSAVDLTINQVNDFRPGQPGSEAVRDELDAKGWFLLDPDRTYEVQALESIRRCIAKLSEQLSAVATRMQESMANLGQKDPEIVEERLTQLGYGGGKGVRGRIESLKNLEKRYAAIVNEQSAQVLDKPFDPTRTLFVEPGPQEFPSTTALEFYLDENPEIKARHIAFMKEFRKKQEDVSTPKRGRPPVTEVVADGV